MTGKRIVGLSDVSVGYGSPQIPAMMRSLQTWYGEGSDAVLIEPDEPQKAPQNRAFLPLRIRRLRTTFHPYSSAGRVDYIRAAAAEISALRPDVLVIFCTFALPVLFQLRRRPRFVIYYALESIANYGSLDIHMNRHVADLVDVIVYPEENRARRDMEICGYRGIPSAIMYNCTNRRETKSALAPDRRNGRLLYQGTIDAERTCAHYYAEPDLQDVAIDLFGSIQGRARVETERLFGNLCGQVRYLGYVDGATLARLRRPYVFNIVFWNPVDENFLYACPNKFFEGIADGIPPITAPHPQCVQLTDRYDCGIVMRDWSFQAFSASLHEAMDMQGTAAYERMARGCREAVDAELNWDKQFERLMPLLRG